MPSIKYYQYRFPFVRPFRASNYVYCARNGIILQLRKDGFTAYGEAAPLPGFSPETLEQVKDQLGEHAKEIADIFSEEIVPGDLDLFFKRHNIFPSLCFALDTLACNLEALQIGFSISRLLFDHPKTSLPVNQVITMQSASQTLESVSLGIREGYRTFKFKIGRDFAEELNILTTIRDRFPDIIIRVDANRAWSFGEALDSLDKLEKLAIEYCEEPLRQPSPGMLEKIVDSSAVPVALDETLIGPGIIRSVASFIPVLILKPMVIGQFSNLFKIRRFADRYDNKVIFTTALESGIGRMMTAVLASGLGSEQSAHGLATGALLSVDVWQDGAYIKKGSFSLPGDPGPDGIYQPDLQHLAEEIYFPSG